MGIAIPGLGSGLDVNSMITSLMAAESKPQSLLKTQQSDNSVKAGAWTSLASIVTALQAQADAIKTPDLVPAVSASSSAPSSVGVSASATAQPGSVTFVVSQLAAAQQLSSAGVVPSAVVGASTTVITSGASTVGATAVTAGGSTVTGHHTLVVTGSGSGATLLADGAPATINNNVATLADGTTITFGNSGPQAGTLSIGIAVTGAGATMADVGAALAAAGGPARGALVDTGDGSGTPGKLVLTATATGSAGAIQVTSTLAALSTTTQLAGAQDAKIVVGTGAGALTITKSSNTVSDLLPGVTINLLTASASTPVTVSVNQDSSGTLKKVQSLVDGLNSTLGWIGTNTAWNSAKSTGGPMMGESGVRDLQDALVRAMQSQPASGSYHSTADLGITLQQDGTYAVDTTKLQAALTADPDSFARYTSSLAAAVGTVTAAANDTTSGIITLGKASVAQTDTSLQAAIDGWTSKLSDIQTRYEKMFSNLDVAMSKMKSQQAQLTSALASLPAG